MEKIFYVTANGQEKTKIPVFAQRKKVKNLNLRVNASGQVKASIPLFITDKKAAEFFESKADWIQKAVLQQTSKTQDIVVEVSKQQAEQILTPIIEKVFEIFKNILGGEMPTIRYRKMKTRWGVCYSTRKIITLNTQLAACPPPAQEYVVLHEFVHFLHPHHQKPFHDTMAQLMPDYKQRKKLLKGQNL